MAHGFYPYFAGVRLRAVIAKIDIDELLKDQTLPCEVHLGRSLPLSFKPTGVLPHG